MATSPWRAAASFKGVKDQPLSFHWSGVTDEQILQIRLVTAAHRTGRYCHQPVPCKMREPFGRDSADDVARAIVSAECRVRLGGLSQASRSGASTDAVAKDSLLRAVLGLLGDPTTLACSYIGRLAKRHASKTGFDSFGATRAQSDFSISWSLAPHVNDCGLK
jgi:hypothetical protein